MKKSSQKKRYPAIPTPGAILHYLVRAVGLPTDEIPGIVDKDFERISDGKVSDEKFRKVIAAVVDRLVSPDQSIAASLKPTESVTAHTAPGSRYVERFAHDSAGYVVFNPAELARIVLEFLSWNQQLRAALGPEFVGAKAREIWIKVFVVPYLAGKAAELKALDIDWEAGMPGGRHWYLPKGFEIGKAGKFTMKQLPLFQVLEWWEDLLGEKLENLGPDSSLCAGDPLDVGRQIRRWRKEGQKISYATIERWTQPHRKWIYAGCFKDDEGLPLPERWARCRVFLEQKNMTKNEVLADEIPPFSNAAIPFSRFFESPDPVSAGLPVEELIRRVAYRWREPLNSELRARLLVASAAQTAITDMEECIGTERTVNACGWFAQIYDTVRPIIASDELKASDSKATARQILRRDYKGGPLERDVIESIFAEDADATLRIMYNAYEQGGRE
jgi:hypothetical protein